MDESFSNGLCCPPYDANIDIIMHEYKVTMFVSAAFAMMAALVQIFYLLRWYPKAWSTYTYGCFCGTLPRCGRKFRRWLLGTNTNEYDPPMRDMPLKEVKQEEKTCLSPEVVYEVEDVDAETLKRRIKRAGEFLADGREPPDETKAVHQEWIPLKPGWPYVGLTLFSVVKAAFGC